MTATVTEANFIHLHGGPAVPVDAHGLQRLCADGALIARDSAGLLYCDPPPGLQGVLARRNYAAASLDVAREELRQQATEQQAAIVEDKRARLAELDRELDEALNRE